MKGEEQTNDAPPTTGSSTINIEGVEYTYTIKKDEKENNAIKKRIRRSSHINLINKIKTNKNENEKNNNYNYNKSFNKFKRKHKRFFTQSLPNDFY